MIDKQGLWIAYTAGGTEVRAASPHGIKDKVWLLAKSDGKPVAAILRLLRMSIFSTAEIGEEIDKDRLEDFNKYVRAGR